MKWHMQQVNFDGIEAPGSEKGCSVSQIALAWLLIKK